MTYPDAELVQWIEDALLLDPRLSARPIHVSADAGVVTLAGDVPTEERKQIARALAAFHPACREVVDCLRVVPPTDVSDAAVARRAQAALDALTGPVRAGTEISVSGGIATLTGRVPTQWERATAADVVLGVPGVGHVNNNLVVAGIGAEGG